MLIRPDPDKINKINSLDWIFIIVFNNSWSGRRFPWNFRNNWFFWNFKKYNFNLKKNSAHLVLPFGQLWLTYYIWVKSFIKSIEDGIRNSSKLFAVFVIKFLKLYYICNISVLYQYYIYNISVIYLYYICIISVIYL